jgi:hypothetical protein
MGYLEFDQELRRRLEAARQERGLSQNELSKAIVGDLSLQPRLSRLENGKAHFAFLDVFQLAKLWGKGFIHGVGLPFETVCESYSGHGNVTITGATAKATAKGNFSRRQPK